MERQCQLVRFGFFCFMTRGTPHFFWHFAFYFILSLSVSYEVQTLSQSLLFSFQALLLSMSSYLSLVSCKFLFSSLASTLKALCRLLSTITSHYSPCFCLCSLLHLPSLLLLFQQWCGINISVLHTLPGLPSPSSPSKFPHSKTSSCGRRKNVASE